MWKYTSTDELRHHGILGQKWGKRNGPPYPLESGQKSAREKRAEKEADEDDYRRETGRKTFAQKRAERRKRSAMKNRGTLSDTDIKSMIERLKLEKELRQLTNEELHAGRTAVRNMLAEVGKDSAKKILGNVFTGAGLYAIKAAVSGKMDREEAASALFNGGPKKK